MVTCPGLIERRPRVDARRASNQYQRLQGVSVGDQVQRIIRMFEAQTVEAREAFVEWLRKRRFMK